LRIVNESNVSLPLAVWLVHDDYDYISDENYISVTQLMRPLRQIILPPRIAERRPPDVTEFIASSLGHAIHDSIEKAWKTGHERALKALGYPQDVIDRIKINPSDDQIKNDNTIIPVFIEQRGFREINGYRIGGKFDLVADGIVQDNKSTSAWTSVFGSRDEEHQLQMSLYRWIDAARPVRRIIEDYGLINYIYTDWSKMLARTSADYPKNRVETKPIQLLPVEEVENWITNKLALIRKYQGAQEQDIPECTDEELWRSAPKFQYFSDPVKAMSGGRATKNFPTLQEANSFLAEKGKGVVKTIPSEPKRCGYCPAFDGCSQKDKYL
jgi:hypothetical protein